MQRKTVLVLGGTGHLGSVVCRRLVQTRHRVLSLSRRGKPREEVAVQRWTGDVEWYSGDALQPSTYSALLNQSHAVVHAVGMISESGYKKFFDAGAAAQSEGHQSFESINRDTAVLLGAAAVEAPSVESLVYISAADLPTGISGCIIDSRYESSKREAEEALLSRAGPGLRPVVLRPGFMISAERPSSLVVGTGLALGNVFGNMLLSAAGSSSTATKEVEKAIPSAEAISATAVKAGLNEQHAAAASKAATMLGEVAISAANKANNAATNAADNRGSFLQPLRVETVAEACINVLKNADVSGVQLIDDIQRLARSMRVRIAQK